MTTTTTIVSMTTTTVCLFGWGKEASKEGRRQERKVVVACVHGTAAKITPSQAYSTQTKFAGCGAVSCQTLNPKRKIFYFEHPHPADTSNALGGHTTDWRYGPGVPVHGTNHECSFQVFRRPMHGVTPLTGVTVLGSRARAVRFRSVDDPCRHTTEWC